MSLRRAYGPLLLIGLLFSIYTLTNAGRFHVVDEVSLFAVTESMGLHGAVNTNTIAWTQWVNSPGEVLGAFGPDGDVYSKKGVGPALAALPWYLLLRMMAQLDISMGLLQGTLLWNGFVTALTAAILWLIAARLKYSERIGMTLALLFGLATIAWSYANQFFGEPLSAFGLLLAFYGMLSRSATRRDRWAFVSGIGAALAIVTVNANILAVAVIVAYGLAKQWFDTAGTPSTKTRSGSFASVKARFVPLIKGLILFAIPVLVGVAFLLAYNYARFGGLFNTGYHFNEGEGFNNPVFKGLYGLMLSPYRGLFWFTPLFFASVATYPLFVRKHKLEAIFIGVLSLLFILMYSMWWMWWAGFAWGPRFLVPLAAFWVLPLAPFLVILGERMINALRSPDRNWRTLLAAPRITGWLFALVVAISIVVQVASVVVNFVNYEILLRQDYPTDWADPLKYGPPAQNLLKLNDSPVFGQFRLMDLGLAVNTDLAWLWQDGNLQLLLIAFGGAVLLTLLVMLVDWWTHASNDDSQMASLPVQMLAVLLPILLGGVWITEVSHNPHYGDLDRGYRAILTSICEQERSDDSLVTVAPFAYQVPMNWFATGCWQTPPIYGYAVDSLQYEEAQMVMSRLLEQEGRIWFVTGGLPPNDPENTLERWLADTGYKAMDTWYEDYRLLAYATPRLLDNVEVTAIEVPLVGNRTSEVFIDGFRMPKIVHAGDAVPVEIHFTLDGPNDANLRWFVQVLTVNGYPVALLDTAPDDGYTPFSALPYQEQLVERAGLLLPEDLPAGKYQVIGGLYNPDTPDAERLHAPDGRDSIRFGTITVESNDTKPGKSQG